MHRGKLNELGFFNFVDALADVLGLEEEQVVAFDDTDDKATKMKGESGRGGVIKESDSDDDSDIISLQQLDVGLKKKMKFLKEDTEEVYICSVLYCFIMFGFVLFYSVLFENVFQLQLQLR